MHSRKIQLAVLFTLLLQSLMQFEPVQKADAQSAAPPKKAVVPDCHPMKDLHTQLLRRFSAMDRFGIRRMITFPYHLQHFAAENDDERNAIAALEKEGLSVSFFLAGRGVLTARSEDLKDDPTMKFYLRKPIINPVMMTKYAKYENLPKPAALLDETRKAMNAFEKGSELHSFSIGKWQIAAMPVRATQDACLKCHNVRHELVNGQVKQTGNGLKLSDPLGAVLYAYKRAE